MADPELIEKGARALVTLHPPRRMVGRKVTGGRWQDSDSKAVAATVIDAVADDIRAAERDAARAEVEFWRTQSECNAEMAAGFLAVHDAARAEVFAELTAHPAYVIAKDRVLAALRAKVEAEPTWVNEYDLVEVFAKSRILHLIEEVANG